MSTPAVLTQLNKIKRLLRLKQDPIGFNDLPIELKIKVWKLVEPRPKNIRISVKGYRGRGESQIMISIKRQPDQLFRVCREWRNTYLITGDDAVVEVASRKHPVYQVVDSAAGHRHIVFDPLRGSINLGSTRKRYV